MIFVAFESLKVISPGIHEGEVVSLIGASDLGIGAPRSERLRQLLRRVLHEPGGLGQLA